MSRHAILGASAHHVSGFFRQAQDHKIPVSIKGMADALEAMQKDVISPSIDEFYYLSRTTLVRTSRTRQFDRAFGEYSRHRIGRRSRARRSARMAAQAGRAESFARTESDDRSDGRLEKLMEALKSVLRSRRAGTRAATSGSARRAPPPWRLRLQPEGVRIGQDGSRNRRPVKVWDAREYRNLDDSVELGTRTSSGTEALAQFAREARPRNSTSRPPSTRRAHAGYLDLSMRPERHNASRC